MLAGGITLANEALGAPYEAGATDVLAHINWRVIPATAIAAFLFSGLEKLNAPAAKILAAMVVVTTLSVPFGNSPSVMNQLVTYLGYAPPNNPSPGHGALPNE